MISTATSPCLVEQGLAGPQGLPLRIVHLAAQTRGLAVLVEAEADHGVEVALDRDEAVQGRATGRSRAPAGSGSPARHPSPPCTRWRSSRRLIEAMSCSAGRAWDSSGSLAALSGSKLAASWASLKAPLSRSTTRARMRSANSAFTSLADMPASPRPAMARMLRCLSSWRFSAWVGLSATAAPATNTEQTRHTSTATVRVRTVDSLLATRRSSA